MASRRPLVIAHRGACASAPENTRAAFDLALAQGADGIEMDVRVTRDNVAVVCHDETVDRTSNGRGRVAEMSLAELTALDFGGWRGAEFAGQKIVTLTQFFDEYVEKTPFLAVEIKVSGGALPAVKEIQRRSSYDRVLVISFRHDILAAVKMLDSRVLCGWLLPDGSSVTPAEVRDASCAAVCPNAAEVTRAAMETIRQAGLRVYPWRIETPAEARRLIDLAVDGLIHDDPKELAGMVKQRDVRRGISQRSSSDQASIRPAL